MTVVTAPAPSGSRSGANAGPGWYESSWDLSQGLVVQEGLPKDASLAEWLEDHLRLQPMPLSCAGSAAP